jgi:hypothetical protein
MSTVNVGGEVIELSAEPLTTTVEESPLYKKVDREKLSGDKRNDLFDRATRTQGWSKFDLMSLSLSDEDKLDDTYNIGVQVGKCRAHMVKYNMHDVFTILIPKADDETKKTIEEQKNLFTDYSVITEDMVATSNEWYRKWPKKDYYRDNLQLSYDFLENNITNQLWEKCLESYEEYPPERRGGPLLFIIMMKKLQNNTDDAVEYLQNSVKGLSITNFDGEDVSRVVSLIKGAHKRLKGVGTSKVPADFPKWLIAIFQTSTVTEFNEVFAHLKRTTELDSMGKTKTTWPSVESLLKIAEKKYYELTATNKWSGVTTKGVQSTFTSTTPGGGKTPTKDTTCWNCNEKGHTTSNCPKPKNADHIEKRRKEFKAMLKNKQKQKKGQQGTRPGATNPGTNKFAPPTTNEKNRRYIDGKAMYWLNKSRRWVPDKNPPGAQVGQPAPTPTPTPTLTGTTPAPAPLPPGAAPATRLAAEREAALSNATHAINTALRSFADMVHQS